jgi:lipoprotein-releasing system permease protein
MYRLFLAIRYLLTRPINLLGMLGVALGAWALIVVVSLFSGFLDVARNHVHSAVSDISVMVVPRGVRWSTLRSELLGDPNVAACAPRLVHYGLLHQPGKAPNPPPLPGRGALQGGDGPFVSVLGVDPAAEATTTHLLDWLAAPAADCRVADLADPLAPIDGLPTILLAESRLRGAGLHRGDHIVLTTGQLVATESGERGLDKKQQEFVVAGAFRTKHTGFDGNNTFVAISTLRAILAADAPEAVQEVAVAVKDQSLLDDTAERLQRNLSALVQRQRLDPQRGPLVQSWHQRERWFLEGVEVQRSLMKAILLVILAVAGVLMLATLSMLATEKTADIGILTAMGGTPFGVMQVFLFCGLLVTLLGTVLGVLGGCFTAVHLDDLNRFLRDHFAVDLFPTKVYNLDAVPYALDPLWILQVAGMALGAGALASALPAWRAARHDPLLSLRGV